MACGAGTVIVNLRVTVLNATVVVGAAEKNALAVYPGTTVYILLAPVWSVITLFV